MEISPTIQRVELVVSHRYAQAHGWVVGAITGWLSAYYMEDPRFRVSRRYDELETGMHVWLCELEGGMSITRLIRRLQADIPPSRIHERPASNGGPMRYIIDLPGGGSEPVPPPSR
jgi:hypothetical protein